MRGMITLGYSETKKHGWSKQLNKAIIESSADYFAFLDCDDIIVPNAIEKVAEFIKLNPEKSTFILIEQILITKAISSTKSIFKIEGLMLKKSYWLGCIHLT